MTLESERVESPRSRMAADLARIGFFDPVQHECRWVFEEVPLMTDRIEALAEVTLAIARAAGEHNPAFAEALGTGLRAALGRSVLKPDQFHETLKWLERFEECAQPAPACIEHAADQRPSCAEEQSRMG